MSGSQGQPGTSTAEVVEAFVAACNGEDLDAITEILDHEMELHEAEELPGTIHAVGLDEVRRYLERFNAHWASFDWVPIEWRIDGDRALLHARLRLTGRKSGIDVDREWSYIFTVRDGKLLRQDGYGDRASAEAVFERR